MSALALLLLAAAPMRAAEFDHFEPAVLPGASVAISSAPEGQAYLHWADLAEQPLGIAVGERPAWTKVVPKREPWRGPQRVSLLPVTPQSVEDGVVVVGERRETPDGSASSDAASDAAKKNAQALGKAFKAAATARIVAHDNSRPFGERDLWEIAMPDGSKRYLRASPLVFDLKGGGVRTSARTVLYDLYGAGNKQRMEWINDVAPGMGLLVFDARRDGHPGEDGRGLFGDSTDLDGDGKPDGYLDGFKALRAFVAKAIAERVIDGKAWSSGVLDAFDLKALERAYGLKMRVGGLNARPRSLAAAGVRAISFTGERVETATDFDRQGNDCARQKGAVFLRADGATDAYEDVWFKPKNNVMVGGR